MRIIPTLAALIPAALITGCNMLNLDPSGKTKPATEETAVGTWRNAEPNADGNTVRMTLRIDADHKMVWARRISDVISDGSDTEYQRENWTWEVKEGKLIATKTSCEYAYASEWKLESAECKAPLVYEIPIVVNGNAWKISEGSKTMVFRKD